MNWGAKVYKERASRHATHGAPVWAGSLKMAYEEFIKEFSDAFTAFDLDRVVALYAIPCTLVHENQTITIATKEALVERARFSLDDMYGIGIRKFEFRTISTIACGACLTLLRYESMRVFEDGRADDPGHETAILRDEDGGPRIVVSINPRSYWRDEFGGGASDGALSTRPARTAKV